MAFKLWEGLHGVFNFVPSNNVSNFFMRLMYLNEVVSSDVEEGLKMEDAGYAFVSVEFSRSFV